MRIPKLASLTSPLDAPRSQPESAASSPWHAALALSQFLRKGRANTVLSGAGISVDSNIPDYRGIPFQLEVRSSGC